MADEMLLERATEQYIIWRDTTKESTVIFTGTKAQCHDFIRKLEKLLPIDYEQDGDIKLYVSPDGDFQFWIDCVA